MGCRTRKYSDGGKVIEREYGGKPTYLKSIAAKIGIGDGYDYFPTKAQKPPEKKRMNVSNAPQELGNVIAKRKKMLDDV